MRNQKDNAKQAEKRSHGELCLLYWNHWEEEEEEDGDESAVPVVDGGPRQDHGVVVGPLGRVAPALLVAVPEVASRRITDDSLWETLPDREGKIHLAQKHTHHHTHAEHPTHPHSVGWLLFCRAANESSFWNCLCSFSRRVDGRTVCGLRVWDSMFLFCAIPFRPNGNSNSASGFSWCGAKSPQEESQQQEEKMETPAPSQPEVRRRERL